MAAVSTAVKHTAVRLKADAEDSPVDTNTAIMERRLVQLREALGLL